MDFSSLLRYPLALFNRPKQLSADLNGRCTVGNHITRPNFPPHPWSYYSPLKSWSTLLRALLTLYLVLGMVRLADHSYLLGTGSAYSGKCNFTVNLYFISALYFYEIDSIMRGLILNVLAFQVLWAFVGLQPLLFLVGDIYQPARYYQAIGLYCNQWALDGTLAPN